MDEDRTSEQAEGQGPQTEEKPQAAETAEPGDDPAWLPSRLKRAEAAAVKAALERLGVGSLDEAEAIVKARREAEEAEKTDLQRTSEALAAAEARAEEAERRAAEVARRATFSDLVRDHDPPVRPEAVSDAWILYSQGDDADGEVTQKTVAAFLKARPHLLATPSPPSTRGATGRGSEAAKPTLSPRMAALGYKPLE